MPLFTSSQFASAAASGTDWRDVSKSVLEQLESVRTEGSGFNVGFLYITDVLAGDAGSILTLFKSVTGIECWTGCVGLGVCAAGEEFLDTPAISAMIAHFPEGSFQSFPAFGEDTEQAKSALEPWLQDHDPILIVTHGDSKSDIDPAQGLQNLSEFTQGFLVGGMSSSRSIHAQFSNDVVENGFSGLAFSSSIPVATALSQGCKPIGDPYRITRCDDNMIFELDGESPLSVFTTTLRTMIKDQTGQDPDDLLVEEDSIESPEDVPDEFKHVFEGDVHVAFPVPGKDTKDYTVRNITGMDEDRGFLSVNQPVNPGDMIMFVHRNEQTMNADLSDMLIKLRKRVIKETGVFEPKGALYVSCVARGMMHDGAARHGEMKLIQDVIGDVPLAGFYAGGEISGGQLYGYTGVLSLFL